MITDRVHPIGRSTAELAARLFNATRRRHATTADCLIATSAIEANAPLVTANPTDFARVEELGLHLVRL